MTRLRLQSEKGTVILVALCFVTVLGISLAGYVALCSRSMQLSNRTAQTGVSQQLAEMGLEEAMRAFNKNDWRDWSSGSLAINWDTSTYSASKRAVATITFPSGQFGQGVTGSVKIRVDNYDANQLNATWSNTTNYRVNDLVGYSGNWYRCVTPHSNQTPTATGNMAYWVPVPIPWTWSGDITYSRHDTVNYGGIWYRCVPTSLTSSTAPDPSNVNWATIPTNVRTWSSSTAYVLYDVVNHNGTNYRCISPNTNQSPPDATYWVSTVNSISLSWSTGKVYTIGAIVYDNGSWYSCITNHTSGATFAGDAANWDSYDWVSAATYGVGEMVYRTSNSTWYTCKTANNNATFTTVNWVAAIWVSSTSYTVGNIVYYSGSWYRCKTANSNASFTAANWDSADWTSSYSYSVGQMVSYQGDWYVCNNGHTSTTAWADHSGKFTLKNPAPVAWQYTARNYSFNDVVYFNTTGSGIWYRRDVSSTTIGLPTNTSYWENALSGSWAWSSSNAYSLNDVVYRSGSFYRCILAHTNQGPPNATYWSTEPLQSTAWDSGKSYSQYDTVRYNGSWYLSIYAGSHYNNLPGISPNYWAIAPRSLAAWDATKNYSIDDLVSSGGTWYRCIKDTTTSHEATSNTTYWVSMTGSAYLWSATTTYNSSSYVNYGGVWYDCILAPTANQAPNDTTYWKALGATVVYAEGTINIAGSGSTKTQLRATISPAPLFSNAIAATGTVTIGSGTGTVDSYDATSSDGYASGTGSTVGYSAVIASNYTTTGAVSINGSTDVKGYLAAPSSSTTPYAPLYSTGGTVKGAGTAGATTIDLTRISRSPYVPQFDIQTIAQQTTLPGTLPTTLNLGTPGSPTPSIYYDSSPALGTTVNINGPVIWYVNGNFRVNSGDTVIVNSTGSLVVYLTGSTSGRLRVESTSGGIINNSPDSTNPDPKKLVIFGDTSYNLTQYYNYTTKPFYGVMYFPNITNTTGLTIASGVTIYGALSAKEVTFSGAANLHYDTSLRHATFAGVDQPYAITEWRELTDATELATMP